MSTKSKPEIRHIYQNHHLDTERWRDFKVRPDDVIISTSYKAGTTWMQTIVAYLIFWDREIPGVITEISPWLDMRIFPLDDVLGTLEAQTHRRFIKSHLPLDGLPYYPEAKYIVVGRDPRDVFMSLLNHWGNHTPEFLDLMNIIPDRVGDPMPTYDGDVHGSWQKWMTQGWFDWENDGWPYWSHLHHIKTWWEFRNLPNIEFFHYGDMLDDLDKEMKRVASYLNIEIPEEKWPGIVEACTFATVKKNPDIVTGPGIDFGFKGGADTFINKGTNGRWKDVLNEEDLKLYEEVMGKTLSLDCAGWIENGGPVESE